MPLGQRMLLASTCEILSIALELFCFQYVLSGHWEDLHLRYYRCMWKSPPLWGTARGLGLIWTLSVRKGDKLPQRACPGTLSPDPLC